MRSQRIPRWKFFASLLFPVVSLLVELKFYQIFVPTVWFLFYPAVFLASWVGGLWSGLVATMTSIIFVNWFFAEPVHSFKILGLGHLIILVTFFVMGTAISLIHHYYKKQVEQNLLSMDQLESLKLQGEQLNLAVQSTQLGIWSWDVVKNNLVWSENMYTLFGVPVGTPMDFNRFLQTLHPDDRGPTNAAVQKSLQEGSYYECEYRIVWPDRSEHWVVGVGRAIKNEAGKAIKMQGIVRNIQVRKELEFDLREEKERFAEAQRIASIASWRLDFDGKFKYSHEFYQVVGLKADLVEKEENIISRLVYPDDQPALNLWFKNCLAGKRPSSIIVRRYFVDGTIHYLSLTGELQHDRSGVAHSILGTVQDVTGLHLKDEALKINEERHRFALESLNSGEWELDLSTMTAIRNKRHDEIFGYEELLPAWTYDMFLAHVLPEDRNTAISGFQNPTFTIEVRILRADKKMAWIQSAGQRKQTVDGREVYVGIVKDISTRKESEIRLKESEARFRSLFEYLPIAYQALDAQGCCVDANKYMADLFGFKEVKDLTGRNFIHFLDTSHKQSMDEKIDQMRKENRISGEVFLRRIDDLPLTVEVASRIQYDIDGKFVRAHYILFDVTQRRELETKIIQLNLELEQKVAERTKQLATANASKSLFLANMSHEIRTPLNAVLGLTQLLYEGKVNPEQKEILHKITLSGRSLLSIVDDILDFSKIEAGQLELYKKSFSMEELLNQLRSVIDVSAKAKGLNLVFDYPNHLSGKILGDAQRIGQILLNLAGNAVKFTESGSIKLRVIQLGLDEHSVKLRFEIEDTGIGIKPQVLDTLFRPFIQGDNTITRRFGGTGLGLSISKRLVELMGGKIGVSSVYEKGSTFWFEITLDRIKSEDLPPDVKPIQLSDWKEHLTGIKILVVDDSEDNLFLAEKFLSKVGAQVSKAENGEKACALLKANPQDFDIVLMDIEMPLMDGLAATRSIRRDLNLIDLPVIALSAGVFAEEKQRALEAGMNDFLSKPMDLKIMVEMIHSYSKKYHPKKTPQPQIPSPLRNQDRNAH